MKIDEYKIKERAGGYAHVKTTMGWSLKLTAHIQFSNGQSLKISSHGESNDQFYERVQRTIQSHTWQ